MPNKPIKQDYKLFGLTDHGYIWWYIWSSRKFGLAELVKHPSLTPTGSMVLKLVKRLPKISGSPFTMYLDNYFTSISLFEIMRDLDIRTCNATRIKSSGKDFPALLKELREDFAKSLP
jgi:hypothetical protein